jgi:hypothetical protein
MGIHELSNYGLCIWKTICIFDSGVRNKGNLGMQRELEGH